MTNLFVSKMSIKLFSFLFVSKMSIKLCNKNLSEANIVFTQDSRFFICASGNEIKVYSVNTGLLVRSLECQGKVSHLIMNPINHLQLYSVSHDGAISLWDFNDGVLLKAWNPSLGQPSIAAIIDARILESSPNQIYMIFELPSKFVVCCYDFGKLENSEIIQFKNKDKFVGFGIYNDTHVIYCAERFISITCIATKTSFRIEPKSKISCFLLHPIDQTVVIGDFTGNITIWYSILNNPVMTSMHWHANAVRSLSFASGGSYLLSGGKEGVLVVWQLSSKHKDFLPRLGSDITRISTSFDETFFALVHKDNTIRIISSINLSIKQTIMGLKYGIFV